MGMGLFIARTIIEAHGGLIQAKNRDHGGASFEIKLPLVCRLKIPSRYTTRSDFRCWHKPHIALVPWFDTFAQCGTILCIVSW